MKTITITSNVWNGKEFEVSRLSISLTDTTAKKVVDELRRQSKTHSPFALDERSNHSFDFSVRDEDKGYIYEAVNL